mmetsp:Transcript_9986/g.12595  ORF Transcript_9986/g.12595 Transcript_9986/m.12595 type:complete len:275 (-) Transcript_9986:34-858(-)|eukprot:CAMPEP_0203663858 /NCGR_PEP_ID=MMETSP0090-20130426/1376_1 /ASSEMBLY_ACC=CAM_ASM_001088 /TAXON_ID=426623 /ORGANISM="Chaetoceros affinis, Strain CCMP159" /LENGTH=274 /DNA_ID=CAMNT_0050526903 /DNA_START=103 /DNA_END=927 /DNA_ORIENTATION=-
MPPNTGRNAAISATETDDIDLDALLNTLSFSDGLSAAAAAAATSSRIAEAPMPPLVGDEPKATSKKPILKRRAALDVEKAASPALQSKSHASMDVSLSSYDSTNISLSSSRRSIRREGSQVSFKKVEVREYDRTLGDNPSCLSGPPISLDWSYSKRAELCMEEYEKFKSMRRRKSKNLLRMGKAERVDMLQNELGYSEEEIMAATKEKKEIQRSRSFTNLTSPLWRVEDAAQSATRKFKRVLRGNKSDSELAGTASPCQSLDGSQSSLEATLEI